MTIDELAAKLPEDSVWYIAKCHKGDMHGKHYAEWSRRVGVGVKMEFCYAETAMDAMTGLVEKVLLLHGGESCGS